ncbi:hypothetical protein GCM10007049_24360 [Echinicola pacifica]|uniref:ASPIC/UnbV domain-containing protein n=1 Tax=Echinicola pacifica TaxID=346377 RepID=A0A918Q1F6_9BACT|nr:VCBS repeat-containing protein [Echinicola pacifica]GGZ30638.1 hypothetical protein GCM10007049_24360 [Echinicola pacifica]
MLDIYPRTYSFPTLLFCLVSLLILPINTIAQEKPFGFSPIKAKKAGISFKNQLIEDASNNILTYEYFYNGGGVALGDLDNDGLDEIFLTGNMSPNALYQNLGDFKFKDISKKAGISGKDSWTTGVTMADINADGYLDIYVCYSGKGDADSRQNELYINNKDLTFSEQASKYGLNSNYNSTQALFFDYDQDGDLEMYLLNHNTEVITEFQFVEAKSKKHDRAGDQLFRNEGGHFVEVTQEAGIFSNSLGFGLGISAADLNGDGLLDLYVSNDYIEHDYLYLNNGDGTFQESMKENLGHISHFSMGLDLSDINNDGYQDIFTLDMLPEDNKRQKLLYGPENYEHYHLMLQEGFHHQNMRNMLQINNGDGTFSEVGQLAGVSNTDWSWSSLFFDADNDGLKDLFITNGYYRDYTNRDFLKYKGDYYFQKAIAREKADTLDLVTSMSSTPLKNYSFRNKGNLAFENSSAQWGLDHLGFSNGAAYSDLNNDGQMDLVVNNLNDFPSIYKNSGAPGNHFLKIKLKGSGLNTSGIGAKITLFQGSTLQEQVQMPTRGFQSSMSHILHFGIPKNTLVDSVTVLWADGKSQTLAQPSLDTQLTMDYSLATLSSTPSSAPQPPLLQATESPIPYRYTESQVNDFKRQPLLQVMPSYTAPVLASSMALEKPKWVYAGGTKGSAGTLYKQQSNGAFLPSDHFKSDPKHTDSDALFFDANGDDLEDLYIASGGYHNYSGYEGELQDRLYINDGNGGYILQDAALPDMPISTATVAAVDYDADGDQDLFVGGRIVPGKYPQPAPSYLLRNLGDGTFEDVTADYLPALADLGMITDASWLDLNEDGLMDLILIGECMPIKIFINKEGREFTDQSNIWLDQALHGLWNTMTTADFDQDGDLDLVLGNLGMNTQMNPSEEEPVTIYYGDFDGNGSVDPILVRYIQGKAYPFASRDELLDQMYGMRSNFTDYESYSNASITDILSEEQLASCQKLSITQVKSIYLENTGKKLVPRNLPIEAQFSPIYSILANDINGDGNLDLVLGGNQHYTRLRIGVIDANYGQVLLGDGQGNFRYISQLESGLSLKGDLKSILPLHSQGEDYLLFGMGNYGIQAYKLSQKP